MNTNLLSIVKRIVAEQGEGILGDPQRLKSFFGDYAKNEPKEDRVAFGRCIEAGFYARFKNARTDAERRQLKAVLLPQIQAASGQSAATCQNALDLLEAAIWTMPAARQPAYSASQYAPPLTQHAAGTQAGSVAPAGKISRKTLIFGAAGGAGAFTGELVSEIFRLNNESASATFWGNVGNVAFWIALIGLGISAGLLIAQSVYLKKKPAAHTLVKTAATGILLGAVAGGTAQIIFAFTYGISVLAEIISRIVCWGIAGWGVGWGVSAFVPNFPKKRAMLAGFLGGFIGGAVFRATFSLPLSAAGGRIIGVVILGFCIGLTISFIEEALREAWLTIVWGPKETTTVSLGQKPVVFGSSREADVYLSPRRGQPEIPPVRAVVGIESGRVILDDRAAGTRRELRNGETADLGRVSIVANIKKGN